MDPAAARVALEAERQRLLAEIDETQPEAPEPMTYGSQAAAATQVFDQNRALALRERAQKELTLVEAALERLEAGGYGTCLDCGRSIAEGRLEALPWAAYCVDCQRKHPR